MSRMYLHMKHPTRRRHKFPTRGTRMKNSVCCSCIATSRMYLHMKQPTRRRHKFPTRGTRMKNSVSYSWIVTSRMNLHMKQPTRRKLKFCVGGSMMKNVCLMLVSNHEQGVFAKTNAAKMSKTKSIQEN